MTASRPALDAAELGGTTWLFYRAETPGSTGQMHFRRDGSIGLHNHRNERFWRIDDGALSLLDEDGVMSVCFDEVVPGAEGLVLRGTHRPDPSIVLCVARPFAERGHGKHTRTALAQQIANLGWSIGAHSYGVPQVIEGGLARLHIGKFCSIAAGVAVCLGDHRLDCGTTYPFKSIGADWANIPDEVDDHATKGDVRIGHDVWLGTDAWIGSGVTIGSGAVIGAKAVVTRSVPPYAVVVGNPGRIARYRFDEATISDLLDLAWWDLPDNAVERLLPLLLSPDIAALLTALRLYR